MRRPQPQFIDRKVSAEFKRADKIRSELKVFQTQMIPALTGTLREV